MKVHIVHVNAGNDTNGNPRRVYICLYDVESAKFSARRVFDEGYQGTGAIPEALMAFHRGDGGTWTTLEVSPRQYRQLIKDAKEQPETMFV